MKNGPRRDRQEPSVKRSVQSAIHQAELNLAGSEPVRPASYFAASSCPDARRTLLSTGRSMNGRSRL